MCENTYFLIRIICENTYNLLSGRGSKLKLQKQMKQGPEDTGEDKCTTYQENDAYNDMRLRGNASRYFSCASKVIDKTVPHNNLNSNLPKMPLALDQ